MSFLLDTNVCIQLLRPGQGGAIRHRIAALPIEDVVVCSPVRYELIFGALRSSHRDRNLDSVRLLLAQFHSLPFDDAAGDRAAELRAALAADGTPIGPADLLIAAIALANSVTLVTHNTAEFGRVRGLHIEDWQ